MLPAVFGWEVDIFQMGGYQVASGWRKTSHGFHKDFLGKEYKIIFNLSFLTVLAAKKQKFPVTIFASKRKRNAAAGGAALKKK